MAIPRIYADFNNADSQGRVRLNTSGSQESLKKQDLNLSNGMKIIIYDEELSADAEAFFSNEENIWVAKLDWSRIKQ